MLIYILLFYSFVMQRDGQKGCFLPDPEAVLSTYPKPNPLSINYIEDVLRTCMFEFQHHSTALYCTAPRKWESYSSAQLN